MVDVDMLRGPVADFDVCGKIVTITGGASGMRHTFDLGMSRSGNLATPDSDQESASNSPSWYSRKVPKSS